MIKTRVTKMVGAEHPIALGRTMSVGEAEAAALAWRTAVTWPAQVAA